MTDTPLDLSRHEATLLLLARYQLPDRIRGKLDPADLVQQTLLEAIRANDKLRGRPDHEVLKYLSTALRNNVTDAIRKFGQNRDEVPQAQYGESSRRLIDQIPGAHTSPSEGADRNERFIRLAAALVELPDTQRLAVEMRYLSGMKVNEIARNLGKSEGAISLLLHRAITTLRDVLTDFAP